jgi:hypothetical protein
MMMPFVTMVLKTSVTAVGASCRLEWSLHLYEIRAKAMHHVLDYMVGPDTKSSVPNFSRQMSISQVPSQAYKLIGIFVSDFHKKLRGGPNLQPSAIFKLQAVSIGHRDRLRKIEEDIFALICGEANAAAVACFKIKRENSCGLFLRPQSGAAVN